MGQERSWSQTSDVIRDLMRNIDPDLHDSKDWFLNFSRHYQTAKDLSLFRALGAPVPGGVPGGVLCFQEFQFEFIRAFFPTSSVWKM